MKLSTSRVGQIFNTGALDETYPEGEIERLLGEYFDELAAKYCAAGPWRRDVENAIPGEWYWVVFGDDDYETCKMSILGQWANRVGCYVPIPKAIATINPPEVQE